MAKQRLYNEDVQKKAAKIVPDLSALFDAVDVNIMEVVKQDGMALNRDIVDFMKEHRPSSEIRKEMNKDRIKALGLKLIQGGKE